MLLVVDANILFSSLIKDSKTAELFLSDKVTLIAPEKIFSEFKKYKAEILLKTNRSEEEFLWILLIFENKIEIIPEEEIKLFLKKADLICPDPDDIEYFALALKFDCPIWSNDKRLKKQDIVKIFSTNELLKLL